MKKKFLEIVTLVMFMAAGGLLNPAEATTLTFDDLNGGPIGDTAVPNGYGNGNWNWSKIFVLDAPYFQGNYFPTSGYYNGMVSAPNVAFVCSELCGAGHITSTVPFNLNSAYITAAWNNNLFVTMQGYSNRQHGIPDPFYV